MLRNVLWSCQQAYTNTMRHDSLKRWGEQQQQKIITHLNNRYSQINTTCINWLDRSSFTSQPKHSHVAVNWTADAPDYWHWRQGAERRGSAAVGGRGHAVRSARQNAACWRQQWEDSWIENDRLRSYCSIRKEWELCIKTGGGKMSGWLRYICIFAFQEPTKRSALPGLCFCAQAGSISALTTGLLACGATKFTLPASGASRHGATFQAGRAIAQLFRAIFVV